MSPISNTKDWGHDKIHGRIHLCHGSGSKYGILWKNINTMGIKIALEIFQNVMTKLTQDMEYVKAYLDDLLILTNKSFNDHLMVLARLSTVGMRINASKSKFFAEQIEYLGYWINRKGIQPVQSKVEPFLRFRLQKPGSNYAN
jgi:Reverse transcriptase (RNA-dependent DNA polymerase)